MNYKYSFSKKAVLVRLIGLLLVAAVPVMAEDDEGPTIIENSFDYELLSGMHSRMEPHGNDLMGDMIDKKTGGLQLEHIDVSIPGNSSLDVAFRRKIVSGSKNYSPHQQAFGNWVLDLPIAYFAYGYDGGTTHPDFNDGCVQDYGDINRRLYTGAGSASIDFGGNAHREGVVLNVSGKQLSGFPARDSVGLLDPKGDWASGGQETDHLGRCVEVAVGPDGTKYKFGNYAFRVAKELVAPASYSDFYGSGTVWLSVTKRYAVYLITEVEDIHGNWVRYEYNNDKELERIYSNDSREISIDYESTAATTRNSRRISQITSNGRTWTYDYEGAILTKVTLPDDRFWEFGVGDGDDERRPMIAMDYDVYRHYDCEPFDVTFSIKHPDGAVGAFTLRETTHLMSTVTADVADEYDLDIGEGFSWSAGKGPNYNYETDPSICYGGQTSSGANPPESLPYYRAMSVVEKTISGQNIPDANWSFEYGGPVGTPLTQTQTRITQPDDSVQAYTYHSFGTDHGLLARTDVTSPSGASESYIYDYNLSQGYPPYIKSQGEMGTWRLYTKRPQTKVTRTRDGVTYTTENEYGTDSDGTFTDEGRPNKVTRFSTLQTEQRVTDIDYWHNATDNIIGLQERVTHNGKEFQFYNYNSKGKATSVKSVGSLWETYTYHSDGTLNTILDALGNTATLTNYHRGKPEHITRRDGTTLERTVDDNGWVTSETNGRGYTTLYDYNDAGWMTKVDRPSPWSDTNLSYSNLGEDDFYRRITRGSHETVEWYDTMLRPTLVREKPTSGTGNTTYVKTEYDELGRVIFRSQPSTSSNPTRGADTTYDGLGRVTETSENFSPFATTTMTYLSGNKVRVTDPRGNQTTTTRSGYASPGDGQTTLIQQPEGVNTSMTYDAYGNILTARQYGTAGGYSMDETQSYVYDTRLRLCRHSTPEIGSTLYQYDNWNQITGVARGQSSGTNCATLPSSAKVTSSYDTVGRVTLINYPDSTPDITLTYDANGNLERSQRGNTDWNYLYDSADHVTEEKLVYSGQTFEIDYAYNSLGHVDQVTYPSGRTVNLGVNALGQTQSVGSIVTNTTYHASGMVNTITYGNGMTYATNLNDRQLPSDMYVRNQDNDTLSDLVFSWDNNGNATRIQDLVNSQYTIDMEYDGLDRLTDADGYWGNGVMTYDSLGNIRTKNLGSQTLSYTYNGSNRLASVAGSNPYTFSYDVRGNVTNNGNRSFLFNLSDQLTSSSGISFEYDGHGRRVAKTEGSETAISLYGLDGTLLYRQKPSGDHVDHLYLNGHLISTVESR